VNQRERIAGSFAKKAAAFFRISRSSRSCRFSFRSCESSSRSAVVSPVRPRVRFARARCTHARRAGFRQIEVACDRANARAFVEDQPDGLCFEAVVESATCSSLLGGVCHRCGHPIRLSESVHQIGSSPTPDFAGECRGFGAELFPGFAGTLKDAVLDDHVECPQLGSL
jgi:hypothetical protein